MKKIKVAVVDDHRIIRDGIVSLFEKNPEIEIANNFSGGAALLKAMESEQFDLVLLDMHMPQMDGIATAKELLQKHPLTKILIHTMSEVVEEIEQIVKLGVHGYILKTAGQEEVSVAIKTVVHGSSYFSSSVMNSFIKSCLKQAEDPISNLNPEEIQILHLLSEGDSIKRIMNKLNLTEDTFKTTMYSIKKKLGLETDFALGKFCALHQKQLASNPKKD